jgi:hypothetical protein
VSLEGSWSTPFKGVNVGGKFALNLGESGGGDGYFYVRVNAAILEAGKGIDLKGFQLGRKEGFGRSVQWRVPKQLVRDNFGAFVSAFLTHPALAFSGTGPADVAAFTLLILKQDGLI